jgi:hypothetical protein
MKHNRNCLVACVGVVLSVVSAVRAESHCPVEVKLLLDAPTVHSVVESLGAEKATSSRVYFFDTEALDLLMQGVIVRVRQGASNDLTVKLRVTEESTRGETSHLAGHFPCEIDQTGSGGSVSYSVRRRYKVPQVAEVGDDIAHLLSRSQRRLLQEAGVSIDWSRVSTVARIKSTRWETASQSHVHKPALELWEFQAGSILEVSARVGREAAQSKYAQLEQIVRNKGLSLSASQATKTSMVLETLTHQDVVPIK